MNGEIAIVLLVASIALLLLISERIRADVVGILVLLALALAGLVAPEQAVGGFSSTPVIAMGGIFVLSAGLQRVGIASLVGRRIARVGGRSEVRLILAIMSAAAVMSFFMNTLGIVALLLPAVMDLARRTGVAPSRLLMPLTFGALLGGLTTMFATLPNLLASIALAEAGFERFGIFDFLPVGLPAAVAGILFVTFIGRHLLPNRDLERESAAGRGPDLQKHYGLRERMFVLRVPGEWTLANKTLEETRLGSTLGLRVVAILRDGETLLAPERTSVIRAHDRLMVQGTPDQLKDLEGWRQLRVGESGSGIETWFPAGVVFGEVRLAPGSAFARQHLALLDLRRRWRVNVVAIRRLEQVVRTRLQDWLLQSGDVLLVQGLEEAVEALRGVNGLEQFRIVPREDVSSVYALEKRLFTLEVPPDSLLVEKTLEESRLGEALALTVLAISRSGSKLMLPGPQEKLHAGDQLLVEGRADDLKLLEGFKNLELEREVAPEFTAFESEQSGLVEAVLSPRSSLAGKTMRQVDFRGRYGLTVLGIWRNGQVLTHNLRDIKLAFGDALLLYGPRAKLKLLGSDPDFIVLTQEAQEPPRLEKAPWAIAAMLLFLIPAMAGWLPVHLAALLGAALTVLGGALRVEEVYSAVEWKAIVLVAGMLPLGIALENSGAASLAAARLVDWLGGLGPLAIVAGVFVMGSIATCLIPSAALIPLLAPLVLKTAAASGVSPHALMMALALSAASGFISPVAHPSNIMVMGPGGYRFVNFTAMGVPLTLVILVVVLVLLPIFWPLTASAPPLR